MAVSRTITVGLAIWVLTGCVRLGYDESPAEEQLTEPDAGIGTEDVDATTGEATVDAAIDAGPDAEVDAGFDAGFECEPGSTVCDGDSLVECNGEGKIDKTTDCTAMSAQCNLGSCNAEAAECALSPVDEGTGCDDDLFCTVGDECTAGATADSPFVCVGGSALECGDQCNTATCNEDTDSCELTPANEGLGCDDSLFCTTGETCNSGVCDGGGPADCTALDDQCLVGTCNPANDACEATPANETLACDDGLACVIGETCTAGSCTGAAVTCPGTGDQCNEDNSCDPAGADGNCDIAGAFKTGACDDGAACNTGETCSAGSCSGGSAVDCSGTGNQCNADATCNPAGAEGNCDTPGAFINGGLPCDDGLACNEGETCTSGVCNGGGATDCSATEDQCNEPASCSASGPEGNCDTPGAFKTGSCDDGLACNTGEACSTGSCTGGAAVDCSGTEDQCNEAASCDTAGLENNCDTPGAFKVGPCDDGAACNTGEACSAGSCTGGAAVDCTSTGDQCNDPATCDPGGLENNCDVPGPTINEGLACDDGMACLSGETCATGACTGGSAVDCSGTEDQCNEPDSCDVAGLENNCDTAGAFKVGSCDDGDACNTGEACSAGSCTGGAAVTCGGTGDQCNADSSCDGLGLEGNCDTPGAFINEAMTCDDTLFCNTGETCMSGACMGGGPTDCSGMNDQCNLGICNESMDLCEQMAINESMACDDSMPCMVGEKCSSGMCTGSAPMDCSGTGDQCNDPATCDAGGAEGNCDTAGMFINEAMSCDDVDACTMGETCMSGACSGGTITCGIFVTSVVAPASVVWTQQNALVEVNIDNPTAADGVILGARLDFAPTGGGPSLNGDYTVSADPGNVTSLASGTNDTLRFWVNVDGAATTGGIEITGTVDAFVPLTSTFSTEADTDNWTVIASTPPTITIDDPLPENNRLCEMGQTDFDSTVSGGTMPYMYLWELPGSNEPAMQSTDPDPPNVQYDSAGAYTYSVTVTDSIGRSNTALAPFPVLVGVNEATGGSDEFPTGTIDFERPSTGETMNLDSLPKNDFIDQNNARALFECNAATVEPGNYSYLTLWIDRGVIDPAEDTEPAIPGIQVPLTSGNGHFTNIRVLASVPSLEGPATVYGEFHHPVLDATTSAGFVNFVMDNDKEDPFVETTYPAPCLASCLSKGAPIVIRFSEPMDDSVADDANTLSLMTVELAAGNDCAAGAFAATPFSYVYDETARTVRVFPSADPSAQFTVRVSMNANVEDASTQDNSILGGVSTCVVYDDAFPAPGVPAKPSIISVDPDPFTPDGDATVCDAMDVCVDETFHFRLNPAPNAALAVVEITRNNTIVRRLTAVASEFADIQWNGRDWTGRMVPNGYYTYTITHENADGVVSIPTEGVLQVDSALHFVGVPPRY